MAEPQIEILIRQSGEDNFTHKGYYANVNEAIEALLQIKFNLAQEYFDQR